MRLAIALLSAVFVLALPALASAYIADQLTVVPAEPIAGDLITISGGGWMPDSCWSEQHTYDCEVDGYAITMTFHTTDSWVPGLVCLTIVLPLEGSCELGALPFGVYSVEVVEMRNSLRSPEPSVQNFTFEVQKAVANQEPSWSMLEGMYGTELD
jgi:hypothetical protein